MSEVIYKVEPYVALAAGYDVVMNHVDYENWAEFVLDIMQDFCPDARSILELGCGTGSLAFEIQEYGLDFTGSPEGFRYLATDGVPGMLRVARAKADMMGISNIRFEERDFLDASFSESYEVVLLLFDGLNYLHKESELEQLFSAIAAALSPGGIAIVDQSTPTNSINNAEYFFDEGEAEGFRYVRNSRYDAGSALHYTDFDIWVEGVRYREEHVQRAWTMQEIRLILEKSPLRIEVAIDGFEDGDATSASERIHWVLRKMKDERV